MRNRRIKLNVRSIVMSAAAEMTATFILLMLGAVMIGKERIGSENLTWLLLIVNVIAGMTCGMEAKKRGREGAGLNAALGAILYSLVCIITSIMAGDGAIEAGSSIRIIVISIVSCWLCCKVNLFKSNKKFHKKSKRKNSNNYP